MFASLVYKGRWPYLAQELMKHHNRPAARKLGITKRIGWHTFRHTYSTLLRSTGAELKFMQELLRHSTIRVTLDTYTQAVTTEKRNAEEARAFVPAENARAIKPGFSSGEICAYYVPFCAHEKLWHFRQVIDWEWRGRRDSNPRPLP